MSQVIDISGYIDTSRIKTLVLLDVQRDCVADTSAPEMAKAIGNCQAVLKHARSAGLQVAFTRWIGRGAFFGHDEPFSGWLDGFEPNRKDLVFDRAQPSCYCNPLFAEIITQAGGHFILAGITGETACLATAIDAFHRGHRVTLLSDASASQKLGEAACGDVHRVVTQVIDLFGQITTTKVWISASSRIGRARGLG
jgi:nicotinamidase-related amidase